ncbi:keratin, type I cytoskeletal 47 kDa-like [Hyla sarda]|uniref:keratin, type I cytoskeletal 47 kDa-like n=1 Tax=Hyla sarda TaxID=327740 RepID=UPI0024C3E56B|nr:keratin, type I cytoskeletal 47 kDa-like [Hyla sarda]
MTSQYKRSGGVSRGYGSSLASGYSVNVSSSSYRQQSGGGGGVNVGFGGGQGNACFSDGYGGGSGGGFGGGSGGGFGGGLGGGYAGGSAGGFGGGLGGGYAGGSAGGFGGGAAGGFGGGSGAGYGSGGFGGGFGGGSGGGYGSGSFGGGFGGGSVGNEGLLSGNEKQTMQNLNDRLASYLDKVKALEDANADLEANIKDWYDKNQPGSTSAGSTDYSQYYQTIEDLQKQIQTAATDNASVLLAIDNARLAADDFKMKYESELHLRQSVEADTNGLKKVLDELTMSKTDFESQIESLTEEIDSLKKNHEEDTQSSEGTTVGQVNVEMDAAPGKDLTKILNDMRAEYEALAEKNRKDAEDLYNQQSNQIKQQITVGVQQEQTNKSEITELRRSLQSLEMELQAQYAMKKSLEDSLTEKENDYCRQISQIQVTISGVEEQLEQIKNDTTCTKSEYEALLDVKVLLEQEIATYQKLLEEGDVEAGQDTSQSSRTTSTSQATTRAGGTSAQTSRGSTTTQTSRSTPSTTQTSRAGSAVSGSGGSIGSRSSGQTSSTASSSATRSQTSSSAGQSPSGSASSGTAGSRYGGQSSASAGSASQSSDVKTRRTVVKTETYVDGKIVDTTTEEHVEPVK